MYVTVNGVRLFVEVLGPKLAAVGPKVVERPTVLVLHGGPSDHAHMLSMVQSLLDIAQVVIYDHRGCGRSEAGDPALWNVNQWGDDVRGLCDVLGIESPIVMGHSFGGMVAQAYALRHPGHAARLILSATGANLDIEVSTEGFRRQGGDEAAEAFRAFAQAPGPATAARFGDACRYLYTVTRARDTDLEARTITNFPLLCDFFGRETREFDFTSRLAEVRSPVLILGGEEDPVLPPPYQAQMEAALINAEVRRVSFPGAGHILAVDAPEALAAELRAWVMAA